MRLRVGLISDTHGLLRPEALPEHLRMNLRVVDEHGRQLGMSRQLSQLQADLGLAVQGSFQAALARIAPASKGGRTSGHDRGDHRQADGEDRQGGET